MLTKIHYATPQTTQTQVMAYINENPLRNKDIFPEFVFDSVSLIVWKTVDEYPVPIR